MSSTPASSRFTAWIGHDERAGLHGVAVELGASDNYVLRSFLRYFLGLPVSPWVRELAETIAAGPPSGWTLDAARDDPANPLNAVPHFEERRAVS